MRSLGLTIFVITLTLTACVSISTPTPVNATPLFVTATLPATDTPYARPSAIATTTPTLSVTAAANCKDAAVLLQDVTISDGANVAYGAKFTKTWEFRNTGTCPWSGYTIAFLSGDRMSAPNSAPIPQTTPKSNVNVSVDLVAPTNDGVYTGFFELRNAAGTALSIGIEKSFWVKITVGTPVAPTTLGTASPAPTIVGTISAPNNSANCSYVSSASYADEIASLINKSRTAAGLASLTVNAQLAAAARDHSIDMACNSLLSHTGSNGSSPGQRAAAAGYGGAFRQEIIYAGGSVQTAFDWWMNDQVHHDAIMDASATEMGVGHANVAASSYGDYYTVDFGSQ